MNWGSAPNPGIYRFLASMMQTGQPLLAAPFMLAPKSALEFHPWRALSSASVLSVYERTLQKSSKKFMKPLRRCTLHHSDIYLSVTFSREAIRSGK